MPNPLRSNPTGNSNNFGQFQMDPNFKNLFNMMKAAQNPMMMLQNMAQSNPQIASVLQMCQGHDPKEVFYSMCKERGIDPDSVLSQFK